MIPIRNLFVLWFPTRFQNTDSFHLGALPFPRLLSSSACLIWVTTAPQLQPTERDIQSTNLLWVHLKHTYHGKRRQLEKRKKWSLQEQLILLRKDRNGHRNSMINYGISIYFEKTFHMNLKFSSTKESFSSMEDVSQEHSAKHCKTLKGKRDSNYCGGTGTLPPVLLAGSA